MPEKGFKMHRSMQIYIERTYGKTQSVVLGGNPRHHRFFVKQVALIFRLTVGAFECLAAVLLLLLLMSCSTHSTCGVLCTVLFGGVCAATLTF